MILIKASEFPKHLIKGDYTCIKFAQDEYKRGLDGVSIIYFYVFIMHKGDEPLTAHELTQKLTIIWKMLGKWCERLG